jgi:hypothetical protein
MKNKLEGDSTVSSRSGLWLIVTFAVINMLLAGPSAAQTTNERDLKRIYRQLIDAEDKHDLTAIRALVWNSPSTLFVAKAPLGWHGYWGIDDVMQHLHDMYQQSFRIDPIYEEEKVVFISPDIAETYAPVRITVAYGGQNPVPKPFVMVLLWIKTPHGWKMTTDIPIPVPPDSPAR